MKLRSLLLAFGACLLAAPIVPAQSAAPESAAAPSPAAIEDLRALVGKVRAKLQQGEKTEAAYTAELAEFDSLAKKHEADQEGAATFAIMKASLYLEVFQDDAKGRELLAAVKTNFPGTQAAGNVDRILAMRDKAAQSAAARAALVGKPAPELHFDWASDDSLKTLSGLKGKVVVLDFWATWCGPCLSSFPQIREHVTRFKESPVEFVGVTSVQGFIANMGPRIDTSGDPAKEYALMKDFMKAKEMTWDVAFSREQVFNPDYGIEGIPYLAIIAPDGTIRHAGLHPGDPEADIPGKIEAILKEFKLPTPKA